MNPGESLSMLGLIVTIKRMLINHQNFKTIITIISNQGLSLYLRPYSICRTNSVLRVLLFLCKVRGKIQITSSYPLFNIPWHQNTSNIVSPTLSCFLLLLQNNIRPLPKTVQMRLTILSPPKCRLFDGGEAVLGCLIGWSSLLRSTAMCDFIHTALQP